MNQSWEMLALAAVFGLVLGSFLNVCALRWPNDESVVRPRSRCPGCGEALAWYDNIPILSWLLLRGRCRRCAQPISVQYPLVELASALIWMGMFWMNSAWWEAIRASVFLTILLGIAVSDARFYIIPDQFSIGGAVLGLGLASIAPGIGVVDALIGAAVGFVLLWLVAWLGEKAFKKEAMGGGDIKMMAMMGAFLGVSGVFLSLFLGALFGAVIFGPISYKTGKLVPFGIFLAIGGAVTLLVGDPLIGWYRDWAMGV